MRKMLRLILPMLLALLLCGCAPETEAEPAEVQETEIVEETPSPYADHCGLWTDEYTGTTVWELRDDGTAVIPIMEYNGYDRLGGYGTWTVDAAGETVTVTLDKGYPLQVFTEDGYTKLWCEELQQVFVRAEDQQGARSQKFVDVTITTDNLWDYFALEQVPAPAYENGERIYRLMWVMRSCLYEEGLVYWDDVDVDMEFVYWTSYRLCAKKAPFGTNFNANSFNSVTAQGTITFVKAEYVDSYVYENNTRTVTLISGESRSATYDGIRYEQYPY